MPGGDTEEEQGNEEDAAQLTGLAECGRGS